MKVRVGDQFRWNRKGAYCLVTEVSHSKIKFEVYGLSFPMSGQMSFDFFQERFSHNKHPKHKKT